uniref:hypothetical protein n=1 Tax=Nonomuraea sp. CA-251285 TaxID=3240002 RepID=UPI003F497762
MIALSTIRTDAVLDMARRHIADDPRNADEINMAAVPLLAWLVKAASKLDQNRRFHALLHALNCQPERGPAERKAQMDQVREQAALHAPVSIERYQAKTQALLDEATLFYDTFANADTITNKIRIDDPLAGLDRLAALTG